MSDNTRPTLAAGLRHREQMVVAPEHTVPRVGPDWAGFRDMPPVFATAMMIGFIEQTCIEALRPYLSAEQRTVGTHVDVSHVATTPIGMTVIASIELIEVEGRILLFRVACHDDAGLIGEGLHRRAIIDLERFMHKLASKGGNGAG
ncbi:MAG TPA: thioesterase family protein [Dyella sp.]|uniref:thioesterase family protein n=1 Tax=Dyella sp. TaxID=1869338 RepID=UPI002F95335D